MPFKGGGGILVFCLKITLGEILTTVNCFTVFRLYEHICSHRFARANQNLYTAGEIILYQWGIILEVYSH